VLNGYQDTNRKSIDRVLEDWFALLDRGHLVTATGNSDTHHLTFNLGGYPRNYVQVGGDTPLDKLDPVAVAAAVKAGHSYFTTGPIVDATIDGHGLGDTVTVKGGHVTLDLTVRAASWVSTNDIQIIGAGGQILARVPCAPNDRVVRFSGKILLELPKDGYVIVRVDGDKPEAPNVGDTRSFPVYPLAITNPIWVDVDGDGKVTPQVIRPH
jgi:hypothetical protein